MLIQFIAGVVMRGFLIMDNDKDFPGCTSIKFIGTIWLKQAGKYVVDFFAKHCNPNISQ